MSVTPVLSIIVIDIAASNALNSLSHRLLTLAYEQVKMVGHEAVGIYRATSSTRQSQVVILHSHPIESRNELVIVLSILEYVLVIDAAHHHMMDTCT